MGGTFERQIRTVRNILNVILYQHGSRLDTSSLRTFMYEVMALVNSRPLTATHLYDHELDPLTPNHLITMKASIVTPPPGDFGKEDIYARKRWKRVQQLTNDFWNRWKNEYLLNLQHRQKWTKPSRSLQINDIVVVRNEHTYRGEWKLGKVVEILGSTDHTLRVRLLIGNKDTLTKNKIYLERPIYKLVLLVEPDKQDRWSPPQVCSSLIFECWM